ncbi:MAG: 16S rRNA (uracil(1498)-N(3))-methyltransferase [Anaerolineaceae bacterium]|nr:16S rRNA (uracil(1498)-N(3))-methyltransferase [Anaerolineaceae bacterium]
MSMHRFFVEPDQIKGTRVLFSPDVSHQIVRVLRLKSEVTIIVLNNEGMQFEVKLVKLDPQQCEGEILQTQVVDTEPKIRLHLIVALAQRDKFEWILQKCCELGIHTITPMLTERSLVMKTMDFHKKQERWKRILKEAAEQSHRGRIPELRSPIHFDQALQETGGWCLIAWENEQRQRLMDVFDGENSKDIAVMVGPEGGFSEQEIQAAVLLGWKPFSMGKRILRMETAAIVACALVFQLSGDI